MDILVTISKGVRVLTSHQQGPYSDFISNSSTTAPRLKVTELITNQCVLKEFECQCSERGTFVVQEPWEE